MGKDDISKPVKIEATLDAAYSKKWRALKKLWPTISSNKCRIMTLLDMVEKQKG